MSFLRDKYHRPSGDALPLILRDKVERFALAASTPSLPDYSKRLSLADRSRIFTAEELEEHILKTSQAIASVQTQILRGEEAYYEETHNHGNVFQGWDGFIDSRDILNTILSGQAATAASSMMSGRRMPPDHRWFSNCSTVPRPHPRWLPTRICDNRVPITIKEKEEEPPKVVVESPVAKKKAEVEPMEVDAKPDETEETTVKEGRYGREEPKVKDKKDEVKADESEADEDEAKETDEKEEKEAPRRKGTKRKAIAEPAPRRTTRTRRSAGS